MGGQIRSFPDKTRLKEYTSTKSARDAKETALRRGRKTVIEKGTKVQRR